MFAPEFGHTYGSVKCELFKQYVVHSMVLHFGYYMLTVFNVCV